MMSLSSVKNIGNTRAKPWIGSKAFDSCWLICRIRFYHLCKPFRNSLFFDKFPINLQRNTKQGITRQKNYRNKDSWHNCFFNSEDRKSYGTKHRDRKCSMAPYRNLFRCRFFGFFFLHKVCIWCNFLKTSTHLNHNFIFGKLNFVPLSKLTQNYGICYE